MLKNTLVARFLIILVVLSVVAGSLFAFEIMADKTGRIKAKCPKCSHVVVIRKCSNCDAMDKFTIIGPLGNIAKCVECGETVVGPLKCPKDRANINKFVIE